MLKRTTAPAQGLESRPRFFRDKSMVVRSVLAIIVGIIGGLGAIVFRDIIVWVQQGFASFLGPRPTHFYMVGPMVGLFVVTLISQYISKEVKGHGVPQILESLALRGGRIRARVGVLGIVAAGVTIGSGGSAGREGPIALIGASFGSLVGQLLRLTDQDISLLLACGSAAGIGATFNAPIAGGFFGLEVILGTYQMGALVPIFLSSITGVTVFTTIMGGGPLIPIPSYHVVNHFTLVFMMGLGAIAAVVGYLYTKGLTFMEDFFQHLKVPVLVKALMGGGLVGAIGMLYPQVLGVGYPTMHQALAGHLGLSLLLGLFVFKYFATLITLGAGGSGGVFAPSLYIGAMFGGVYGLLLHSISAGWAPFPEIYGVAGMAAMFAAAAQAPFVAITIILEMTGDYHLAGPVIGATIVAYWLYGYLSRYSMYTVKLRRQGIVILRGNDVRPADQISVRTALKALDDYVIPIQFTVVQAYQRLTAHALTTAFVVDSSGQLVGSVSLSSLMQLIQQGKDDFRDAMAGVPRPLSETTSLDEALRRFGVENSEILPVKDDVGDIVGILAQHHVLQLYNSALLHTLSSHESESPSPHGKFIETQISEHSDLVDRSLADLKLPSASLVISIVRTGQTLIAHGQTRLQPHDILLIYVTPSDQVGSVRSIFEG